MKAPATKLNKWKVIYKQIPYDDRYFFVYYNNILVGKIPSHFTQIVDKLLPYGLIEEKLECRAAINQWERFIGRVEKYNASL